MKFVTTPSIRLLTLGLAVFGLVALSGCSKSAEEAGKAAVEKAEVPDKPEEVVKTAAEAIRDHKPVGAYALLPDSYRKDIQGVVSHATGKLDKELFELAVKVLGKAVACTEKHGDKIAGLVPPGAMPMDTKEALAKFKEFVGLLEDAKLLDYDELAKLDVAGFLSSHGPKLMKEGMFAFEKADPEEYKEYQAMMKDISATAKKVEGDTAEVELKTGEETETIKLTKVDGRWVPAEMATEWKAGIDEAKKGIDEGLGELTKNKAEIKPMLEMALAALTKFEETGDPAALEDLMKMAN